jgi:hypothetical protein
MGQDNDAGNASAYAVRGMIEARLGELSAANQDLSMAEESARKAISAAKKRHEGTTPYEHMLVQYLAVDAAVLKRLDRPDDAQKKIYEESQYH